HVRHENKEYGQRQSKCLRASHRNPPRPPHWRGDTKLSDPCDHYSFLPAYGTELIGEPSTLTLRAWYASALARCLSIIASCSSVLRCFLTKRSPPIRTPDGEYRSGSGKEVGLPRPPPLRTVRATFAAYGSSLYECPSRDTAFGTAFTIRAWSRRTLRETACQSMACQPVARPGAAPAGVAAADSCLSPSAGWPSSLVTKDQREVIPRSGGVLSPSAQPLSAPLRGGLRFLPPPRPAAPSVGLAASLPQRGGLRVYHVPSR